MSVAITINTDNLLAGNYDTSKIFLSNRSSEKGRFLFTNGAYDKVLSPGTLLGRKASDNTLVPFDSAASNGSQFPVGVLMSDLGTLLASATLDVQVTMCVAGDVAKGKILFRGTITDTLLTVVASRTVADRIAADTVGIKLIPTVEMTEFDNS